MAAKRNLEDPGNKSFSSFSDAQISSKVINLGISLGRDNSEVASSVISLKHIEIDRLKVAAKVKGSKKISTLVPTPYDEIEEDILDADLNHFGGDLNEEAFEEGLDHICCDLNVTPRKKKSKSSKKNKVARPPKKPNTPSKLCLQ